MSTFTVLYVVGLLAALQVLWVTSELPGPNDIDDIVDLHNQLRRNALPTPANMCKMNWSSEAADNANYVANQCYSGHSSMDERLILFNEITVKCGENIFKSTAPENWTTPITAWYNEVEYFQYGDGPVNDNVTGHYTQVVWYKSNLIGCARAYCPGDEYEYVTVCHYCPPGNFNPHTPYLTGEPCSECQDACEDKLCTNPCNLDDYLTSCYLLQWLCHFDFLYHLGLYFQNIVPQWCDATCNCPENTLQ